MERVYALIGAVVCSSVMGCGASVGDAEDRTEVSGPPPLAGEGERAAGTVPAASSRAASRASCVPTGGWSNTSFSAKRQLRAELVVTPTAASSELVMGLALGAANDATDLAAAVRFAPNGTIDARNGAAWAATNAVSYQAGETYELTIEADVWTGKYSVRVSGADSIEHTLAIGYRFRDEQAGVDRLDHFASSGSLALCEIDVLSAPGEMTELTALERSSSLAVAPDGTVAASAPGGTAWLDADGDVIDVRDFGGSAVYDPAGNFAFARTFSGSVTVAGKTLVSQGDSDVLVAKLDPELELLWVQRLGTAGADQLEELAVDAQGRYVVTGPGIGTRMLGADGVELWSHPSAGSDVATDPAGRVVLVGSTVTSGTSTAFVTALAADGTELWTRSYASTGGVSARRVATDGADRIYVTGAFHGELSFGGALLSWNATSPEAPADMGYVLALDLAGQHVFSDAGDIAFATEIVADAQGFALTGNQDVSPPFIEVRVHDASGALAWLKNGAESIGNGTGFGRDLAIDPAGTLYFSVDARTSEGSVAPQLAAFRRK